MSGQYQRKRLFIREWLDRFSAQNYGSFPLIIYDFSHLKSQVKYAVTETEHVHILCSIRPILARFFFQKKTVPV